MVDTARIGTVISDRTIRVPAARVAAFATAIGDSAPHYHSDDAAKAAGYAGRPLPPTLLFTYDVVESGIEQQFAALGIRFDASLHGEQRFRYFRPLLAEEPLRLVRRLASIEPKRGGEMEIVTFETEVLDGAGLRCAVLQMVMVVFPRKAATAS